MIRKTAVVIGSGFGGSVTACRLAQAAKELEKADSPVGLDVIVVERGRRYGKGDFPRLQLPASMTSDPDLQSSVRLPDFARFSWRNDYGLFDVKNLGQLLVLQAAGLGGGSLIYGNVLLRAPEHVLASWPARYHYPQLVPYYELAEGMLGAAVAPPSYQKTQQFEKAAAKLKLPVVDVPLAINFGAAFDNAFGKAQGSCNGCGDCVIGCSLHAKNTLDLNYLALAEANGAEIHTLTEVRGISQGKLPGQLVVQCIRHDQGEQKDDITADYVFLAAGALGTTDLLLRSPSLFAPAAPTHVGRNVFANGDSLGVVFDTVEPNTPWSGPTITRSIVHRQAIADPDAASQSPGPDDWFLIQDGGLPPTLKRALGYFHSGMWLGRNRFGPVDKRALAVTAKLGPLTDLFMDLPLLLGAFRRNPSNADTPVEKEWQRFLPPDLWPVAQFISNPGGRLRREIDHVDQAVMDRLQSEIGRRFGLASWLPGIRRVVNREVMLDSVIGALQTRYSVLGYITKASGLVDTLLSAAQYLLLGQGPTPNSAVFLAMGPDHAWILKRENDRLRATRSDETTAERDDVRRYGVQERVMRQLASELGGELRTNPGWTIGRRPVTVHTQGGCVMPGSVRGAPVTDEHGEVSGVPNLYVMDAAAFPHSVGVNPSLTIAAVAERKVERFIEKELIPGWANHNPSNVKSFVIQDRHRVDVALANPQAAVPTAVEPIGIEWSEWLNGTFASSSWKTPVDDAVSEPGWPDIPISNCEDSARWGLANDCHVEAALQAKIPDLDYFLLQVTPTVLINGTLQLKTGALDSRQTFRCQGKLRLYIDNGSLFRMKYHLTLTSEHPDQLTGRVTKGSLMGTKYFTDDPGMDSFLDATTLFTQLTAGDVGYLGIIRVPLVTFIGKQIPTFAVTGGDRDLNAAGKVWALARFAKLFFGSMADVYMPELFFRGHKG